MDRVGVSFGRKDLLSDFSLRVGLHEKVCLRGASGCGKSTVLCCLLGLVIPRKGEIHINGRVLASHTIWDLRSQMAWVPQEPDWGTLTVRDALERPFAYRLNRALPPPGPRITEWLERLNISAGLLEQPTANLSGGERQRISLVAALLLNRPILLLDEITSALDETNRNGVRDILADLRETTVFAISHNATEEKWADRIVDMGETYA